MPPFVLRSLPLVDLVALWVALLFAAYFTGPAFEGVRFLRLLEWRISLQNLLLLLVWSGFWLLLSYLVQTRTKTTRRFVLPTVQIAVMTGIGVLVLAASSQLFAIALITPQYIVAFALLYFVASHLLHWLYNRVLRFLDPEQHYLNHTVLLGATPLAAEITSSLRANAHFRLLGYFGTPTTETDGLNLVPCLGQLHDFAYWMHESVVDQVVVTLPLATLDPAVRDALSAAEAEGIEVLFPVPLLAPYLPLPEPLAPRTHLIRWSASGHGAVPLLSFDSGPQMGWALLVKRLLDVTAAALGILILSPLFLLIALAIRVTMGSPVLFVQPRLGYHRRIFPLYKFRTMIPNADALRETLRAHNDRDGAAFKMRNDPRITPLGRWLRKLNLDELPQLFNVLRGDMSLVGPRPLPLDDYARMDRITYLRRVSVLPGITCTWQIAPNRASIPFDEWMRMDLAYIDDWSLHTDLLLLVKTVWVTLRGKGDQ
ncbi:exopolysaccharide biosynthesis polyprenyl glycosylphosphotransferase [Hydrogenophilus thermoluteolus]|uniref:Bacterial sugar transferase domain-containing protein n=1 Tax=Hydrogenophilus thermoluteolus TaxID=297 RepID=A0A2Z6E017_HYDTE|nr:exopolysaccharide biosynthesis polyprenyl glycosylphosphotransferase [Hydrogenophilus thermoluteolus]MBW7656165.1 exopolysaccharide biosynthesis polyprenyl glycosylphosphotransferase [Hydrogenophilus thermoluteolus]BBD78156.1 hypothetical protein HPTL_1900 [Hydrogenophilus thermoluteolus]